MGGYVAGQEDEMKCILYIRTFDGRNWFVSDNEGRVLRPYAFLSEQEARNWCAAYRPKCDVAVKRYDGVKAAR